ncbi:MAG: hypothetical protein WCA84_15425 [Ignavibacteriaceae bacterium]
MKKIKIYFISLVTATLIITTMQSTNAQVDKWLEIIRQAKVAVKYYSPVKSGSFTMIQDKSTEENEIGLIKEFVDENLDVKLTFKKYDSHIELFGEASSVKKEDLCFTLKIIFPQKESGKNVSWSYDLDSTVVVGDSTKLFSNYVKAAAVIPPDGAFNTDENHNGGYGDKLGSGEMSFYPLAAVSSGKVGFGLGVDMGIPVVYRLAFEPGSGIISEFDMAVSKLTKKFPNRTFFKLFLFEYNYAWNMRAALEKYYQIQPEYFKRRVTNEGIWLPFTPLHSIKDFKDFGFAFHETSWPSKDRHLNNKSSIEADKEGGVYSFEYTEPWDIQIPIDNINIKYKDLVSDSVILKENNEMLQTSAALDDNNLWETRKLKTPWFKTGWAVSITTNADPDLPGYNRYDMTRKEEINPAINLDVDGIYFDSMEWNWHYDLNYNQKHFPYTEYPLTFSSSLDKPRPAIWNYVSEYEMMNNISNEMHEKGKLTMGNGFGWLPFAPGILDLFGSEFSWYAQGTSDDMSLGFIRAISYQKPIVFLLNEGLDDKVFNKPPYDGYRQYFERMLSYGFFPSFFSVNSSSDPYWEDSTRYNNGRPFFKKYIPLIREISQAGWQPVTFAKLSKKVLQIERFGTAENSAVYFTIFNSNAKETSTKLTIDSKALNINKIQSIEEVIKGKKLNYMKDKDSIEVTIDVNGKSTCLIKINKL